MTLPGPVRSAALRVVQAAEQGSVSELRAALEEVLAVVSGTCDGASKAELKRLLIALGSVG